MAVTVSTQDSNSLTTISQEPTSTTPLLPVPQHSVGFHGAIPPPSFPIKSMQHNVTAEPAILPGTTSGGRPAESVAVANQAALPLLQADVSSNPVTPTTTTTGSSKTSAGSDMEDVPNKKPKAFREKKADLTKRKVRVQTEVHYAAQSETDIPESDNTMEKEKDLISIATALTLNTTMETDGTSEGAYPPVATTATVSGTRPDIVEDRPKTTAVSKPLSADDWESASEAPEVIKRKIK